VAAACPSAALEPGEQSRVEQVLDGDTFVLAGGLTVRLAEAAAPKPLIDGQAAERPNAAAAAALTKMVSGREVELRYGGRRRDRRERALAHVFVQQGGDAPPVWVQRAMVEAGRLRVMTFADNRACAAALLSAEAAARAAGRGLWASAAFKPAPADAAEAVTDRFALVEGRVLDAADVRGRIYLNFGPDYRTDFTVSLEPGVVRLFRAEGVEPLAYEGRRVRVRGWVDRFNGPLIAATHPEEIELLGED